eukprot:COSAG06_NODE_28210_length_578_cov_1.701461_2_plen_88_part_00
MQQFNGTLHVPCIQRCTTIKAMNNEVSRSTGLTAQQYMRAYLAGELELTEVAQEHAGEAQVARKRIRKRQWITWRSTRRSGRWAATR